MNKQKKKKKKKEKKKEKKEGIFSDFFKHLKAMDKPLLFIVLTIILFGIVSIITASSRETITRYDISMYYFFRMQMRNLGFSLIAAIAVFSIPTNWYRRLIVLGFGGAFALILSLFIYGEVKKGSGGWLNNGSIQPDEFAKPIIIIAIAVFFEYNALLVKRNKPINLPVYFGFWFLLGMVIPIITVLQGDMGTALLTMTISGVMLLFGPIPFKDTLKCVGGVLLVGIVGIACFIVITQGKLLNNVQTSRLTTFTQQIGRAHV